MQKPTRYIVYFPSNKLALDEEAQDNYSSYSTELDKVRGLTKAYSLAVAAAKMYGGTIFEEINGELHKLKIKWAA